MHGIHEHDHAADHAADHVDHADHVNLLAADTSAGSLIIDGLLLAKIVAMIVMIAVTLFCSGLPYMLNRWYHWTKKQAADGLPCSTPGVQCALYFGGGVLLCTTFLHILPEVIETIEHLQADGTLPQVPFALAPFLMCVGFFVMCLIDEIMHWIVHRHHARQQRRAEIAATVAAVAGVDNAGCEPPTPRVSVTSSLRAKHSIERCTPHNVVDNGGAEAQDVHDHHHHHHLPITTDHADVSQSLRGLGIIVALSMHELFEGIAIGLESTVSTVWMMFAAISAHKLVLAFCVGMELLIARTRTRLAMIYLLTFAIMTPIGIGVGIAISDNTLGEEPSLVSGVLQGLACGTLLYVIFFEILSRNQSGWRAYVAALAGFAVMFTMEVLSHSTHSHSHGSHDHGHEMHAHSLHSNESVHLHLHDHAPHNHTGVIFT